MVVDVLNSITSLVQLFSLDILSLNTELEVELAACLKRLFCVVSISLDVLEKSIRSIFVRVENVLNDFESENFLLDSCLVVEEILFFSWNFTSNASSSGSLLLAGELPVLKLLHADLEGLPLLGCLSRCLLVEGALGIDDEG